MGFALAAAIASIVAAAVSAGLTYASARQQAQTTEKMAKYNATVAENQATSERNRAAFAADQQRAATRRTLARQRALYGTAGVETSYGSPLMVTADSAYQGELDAQVIKSGGEARSSAYMAQAGLDTFRAHAARGIETSGALYAGSTLLSGAATGSRYYAQSLTGGGGGGSVSYVNPYGSGRGYASGGSDAV
jgi:hypothetical protein